jgi:hypothetical protein
MTGQIVPGCHAAFVPAGNTMITMMMVLPLYSLRAPACYVQVGAWVSNQSKPIAGRDELEAR